MPASFRPQLERPLWPVLWTKALHVCVRVRAELEPPVGAWVTSGKASPVSVLVSLLNDIHSPPSSCSFTSAFKSKPCPWE